MTSPDSLPLLALELNIPHADLRDRLGIGSVGRPEGRALEVAVADLRTQHAAAAPTPKRWVLDIGDTVSREALVTTYKADRMGGILAPTHLLTDIILVTDPVASAKNGYDEFEGPQADGTYWYTGQGQVGDQTMTKGNKHVLDSPVTGRRLRLMRKSGTLVTYVGEFALGEHGYRVERIKDKNGELRNGIIWELVPIDATIELVGVPSNTSETEVTIVDWVAPEYTDIVIEAPTDWSPTERKVTRAEFELQSDFGSWVAEAGESPSTLKLRVGAVTYQPDLYVPGRGWLVEAKRSISREDVRMAIGQVLDYAQLAQAQTLKVAPLILLPSRPAEDLVALMRNLKIRLAYRAAGSFVVE